MTGDVYRVVQEPGSPLGRLEKVPVWFYTLTGHASGPGWMQIYTSEPSGKRSQLSLTFKGKTSWGLEAIGDGQTYFEHADGKMLYIVFVREQDGSTGEVAMLATPSEIGVIRKELRRHWRNARRRQKYSRN